jgi:hypothetical protein
MADKDAKQVKTAKPGDAPEAPAPQGGAHGIASGHNPGGTLPGGGPGAGLGSIGTGGAATGGAPTGSVKRGGR